MFKVCMREEKGDFEVEVLAWTAVIRTELKILLGKEEQKRVWKEKQQFWELEKLFR